MALVMNAAVATAAVLILVWAVRLVIKFNTLRQTYAKLPGPPHSYWFGHLKILGETFDELPPGIHLTNAIACIAQKYDLKEAWYLDLWPASTPFVVIASAEIAQQVTVHNVFPKHPVVREYLGEMTGDKAVVTLEGQEWKDVRSVLMPAFAPSYVLSLAPMMLQYISILCDRLAISAEQDSTVKLQSYLTDMTIDIIGYTTLGINLDTQRSEHPIANAFKRMVVLAGTTIGNPLNKYKNAFGLWQATRQITNEVRKAVIARWEETKSMEKSTSKLSVDLVLSAIRNGSPTFSNPTRTLDDKNLKLAIDQVKTLLLGGHDTTAATLAYAICLLSQHPEVLSRIREEHSHLVTPTMTRTEAIQSLTSNLSALTNLHYTHAVIKETMRIYPTSATARIQPPNSPLKSITTKRDPSTPLPLSVPGADQNIWLGTYLMHHDSDIWPEHNEFIPDRFLPDSDYAKAYPFPSYAWRPFEKGARACIGSEQAMVEMRLALIMLLREFDFEMRYPKDAPRAPKSLGGQAWYQVLEFAAKPVGGLPVGVKRRIDTIIAKS